MSDEAPRHWDAQAAGKEAKAKAARDELPTASGHTWERIEMPGRLHQIELFRVRVPGGWVYLTKKRGASVATTFVPEAQPQT